MLPAHIKKILESLDFKDMKKLGYFIKSPYFNTNPAVEKLYAIIKRHHPNHDSDIFKLENIFKKIYPGNEFKEQTIRNLYSEFAALLRKYIGYEELEFKNYAIDTYIGEGLTRRGLYEISEKFVQKSISQSYEGSLFDIEMFLYFFRLEATSINNIGYLNEERSHERLDSVRFSLERLTIFFLAESLHISIEDFEIFSYNPDEREDSLIDNFYKTVDMRRFIAYLENTGNKYASFIKIRYLLYYYHLNPFTENDYYELKAEIFKIIRSVKKIEQLSFITIIVILVTKRLLPANRKLAAEIFEFAELLRSLNIFSENSTLKISLGLFRNFFTIAVILKKYDWTEKFIAEYVPYLSEESRENEANYSMGILSFKQGKYKESLSYLNKFKMNDIGEKINTRYYILMNYIEMKAYESAFSVLHSIRQFYFDREIPEVYSELMEDSIKFFNEIIKSEEAGKKIDGKIYTEALNSGRFYHKQYVLDKIRTLL